MVDVNSLTYKPHFVLKTLQAYKKVFYKDLRLTKKKEDILVTARILNLINDNHKMNFKFY